MAAAPASIRTGSRALFNTVGNAITTIVIGCAILWIAPQMFPWGILNAVFTPDAALCRKPMARAGA